MSGAGWDPTAYGAFGGLRLRPALDLLARVPVAEPKAVVDLGCGAGAVAPALRTRWGRAQLIGVDPSPEMRAAAPEGAYDVWMAADAEAFAAAQGERVEVIFSNAALHWAADHARLFPQLMARLSAGGALAVQMPAQGEAASHRLIHTLAAAFGAEGGPPPPAMALGDYADLLAPAAAALDLWETVYWQRLAPAAEGHPVRHFTFSTAARPVLAQFDAAGRAAFLAAYDAALEDAYPRLGDGGVWFPFRRIFLVATAV